MTFKKSTSDVIKEIQRDFGYPVEEYITVLEQLLNNKLTFTIPYSLNLVNNYEYSHLNKFIHVVQVMKSKNLIPGFFITCMNGLEKFTRWVEFNFNQGHNGLNTGMWLSSGIDDRFDIMSIESFNKFFNQDCIPVKYLI